MSGSGSVIISWPDLGLVSGIGPDQGPKQGSGSVAGSGFGSGTGSVTGTGSGAGLGSGAMTRFEVADWDWVRVWGWV